MGDDDDNGRLFGVWALVVSAYVVAPDWLIYALVTWGVVRRVRGACYDDATVLDRLVRLVGTVVLAALMTVGTLTVDGVDHQYMALGILMGVVAGER